MSELAVVLAAGYGTRLGPVGLLRHRSTFAVNGIPLLVRALDALSEGGITETIVVTGHLGEQVEGLIAAYGSSRAFRCRTVRDSQPRGTLGSLRCARHMIDGRPFISAESSVLVSRKVVHDLRLRGEGTPEVSAVLGLTDTLASAPTHSLAAVGETNEVCCFVRAGNAAALVPGGKGVGRFMGIGLFDERLFQAGMDAIDVADGIIEMLLRDERVTAVWDDGSFRHFSSVSDFTDES